MTINKFGVAAVTIGAAAATALGVALTGTVAHADPTAGPTTTASAGTNDQGRMQRQGGMNPDTVVTGDEAQKVIDAVKAKDSAVTIDHVRKDADGSYDAVGTKDGNRIHFDVSADLATITENAGGPGGPRGGHGPGMSADAVVSGDEAQRVIDAVQAKNPGVTIDQVRKDADGSYDAMGTKDGQKVCFDVSADLGTVTENAGPQGGQGPHGPRDAQPATNG